MVAKKVKSQKQQAAGDPVDQENDATGQGVGNLTELPEVKWLPDMANIFQQAEKYQSDVNTLSLAMTKTNLMELQAVSTPAVELALATLAEAVSLKENMSDFFKPATS